MIKTKFLLVVRPHFSKINMPGHNSIRSGKYIVTYNWKDKLSYDKGDEELKYFKMWWENIKKIAIGLFDVEIKESGHQSHTECFLLNQEELNELYDNLSFDIELKNVKEKLHIS